MLGLMLGNGGMRRVRSLKSEFVFLLSSTLKERSRVEGKRDARKRYREERDHDICDDGERCDGAEEWRKES